MHLRPCTLFLFLALSPLQLLGHPEFGTGSIVNSASFMPVKLPAGAIARGSIFTIFGSDMGPKEGAFNPEFPLRKEIGGVTIQVLSGIDVYEVVPLYAGPFQINAIMPSNVPVGPARIIANYVGGLNRPNSIPVDVQIVDSSFGIYTFNGTGQGPAALQNFVSDNDTPSNSLLNSARPGQFVILWGTGLGAAPGADNEPPVAGDLPVSVEVFVGGKQVSVLYRGRSGCCAGVDQIVFQVPEDAALGCYVPIYVQAGQRVSNSATMSIAAQGGLCSDPVNSYVGPDRFGPDSLVLGAISVSRTALSSGAGGPSLVSDAATALFGVIRRPEWFFEATLSMPALGTCVSYQFQNRSGGLVAAPPSPPRDAGQALTVSGVGGSKQLPRISAGNYAATLGTQAAGGLVLEPGSVTISAAGGADVSGFQTSVPMAPAPQWSSQQIAVVNRQQGVTVEWSPSGGAYVRIMGTSESSLNAQNNENGVFLCTAPAEAGRFTVPREALANLPASSEAGGVSTGALYVGVAARPVDPEFDAQGLDLGIVGSVNYVGRLVRYQ